MELAVVLPHDGVGMRSRLDANQVLLLLANCARSIEHSRARGFTGLLIESWTESCMDRVMYGVSVERGAGNGEKIQQIGPSFHVCLFPTSAGGSALRLPSTGKAVQTECE
jgi:hypothetical protein